MKDSAFIALGTIGIAALMVGSFALGRWERRTIYTPGPPEPEPKEAEAEKLAFIYPLYHEPGESVRLVPRYPSEPDWPPPGTSYIMFPEEQEFWMEKLGDPTKPKVDPVVAALIEKMLENMDHEGKRR